MGASPRATLPAPGALRLALLDAVTAGAGLGYLAHQYREALVANLAAIGMGLLFTFVAGCLVRASARVLRRAGRRVDAIFAEELREKPSPRPR